MPPKADARRQAQAALRLGRRRQPRHGPPLWVFLLLSKGALASVAPVARLGARVAWSARVAHNGCCVPYVGAAWVDEATCVGRYNPQVAPAKSRLHLGLRDEQDEPI